MFFRRSYGGTLTYLQRYERLLETASQRDRNAQRAFWTGYGSFVQRVSDSREQVEGIRNAVDLGSVCANLGIDTVSWDVWQRVLTRVSDLLKSENTQRRNGRIYAGEASHIHMVALNVLYGRIDAVTGIQLQPINKSIDA